MQTALDLTLARLQDDQRPPRDMIALLFFLGLVGTIWAGVAVTFALGDTVQTLSVASRDTAIIFEDLRQGLAAPLSGLGMGFSSSLFGFVSALIVLVLSMFSNRAFVRVCRGLEDWLLSVTDFSRS
jgi:hypothetical protein